MKFCAYCVGLTGLGIFLIGMAAFQKIIRPQLVLPRAIVCVKDREKVPYDPPINRIPNFRPVASRYKVSSPYGIRLHPIFKRYRMHTGIDFPSPSGTPVRAAASGTVEWSTSNTRESSYGKYILICHDDEYSSLYAHLSRVDVQPGEEVFKGDTIGLSGNTGLSKGPHLHFEIFHYDKRVDPLIVWKKEKKAQENSSPNTKTPEKTYASNP